MMERNTSSGDKFVSFMLLNYIVIFVVFFFFFSVLQELAFLTIRKAIFFQMRLLF